MAKIELKIYSASNKKEVEKVYTAEGYELLMGTIDDFIAIIDIDKLSDNVEVAKMVAKGYGKIKPLLTDIFPELTDEEYRRVSLNGLIETVLQIGASVVENISLVNIEKNLTRA